MKRVLQRCLLLIAGTAAAAVIAESVLFLLGIPAYYNSHTFPRQFSFRVLEDGTFFYTNSPSDDIVFIYDGDPRGYFGDKNEVVHTTNSWGFRGGEFSYEKRPGFIRMAFLGDSFTFGEGVRFDDVYTERLKHLLQSKYDGSRVMFESHNFGVGGYNMGQSLYLLKNLVLLTRPDIIFLGYTLNDAEPELFFVDPDETSVIRRAREADIPEGMPQSPPDSPLYSIRLTKLLWQAAKRSELTQKTLTHYKALYEPDNPSWVQARKDLREFLQACESNKIHCFVMLFPILYRLEEGYPFLDIHTLIKDEVESADSVYIHFVDLLPYIKGEKDAEMWVHPTDQHPNDLVHKAAAEALLEEVSHVIR